MSLRYYMDEHVAVAITDGLRSRGVDVLTVQEDGMRGRADSQLLDRATSLGRVLFSQDADLVREGVRRQRQGAPFTGVVYAHPVAVTIGRCVEDLELLAKALPPDELMNRIEYLPLR